MIQELLDNRRPIVGTLAVIIALFVGWGNYNYASDTARSQSEFKQAICSIITQSQKADKAQVEYYQGLEDRATDRAKVDTGTARQADLDAASSARHSREAYQKAEKFKFPTC